MTKFCVETLRIFYEILQKKSNLMPDEELVEIIRKAPFFFFSHHTNGVGYPEAVQFLTKLFPGVTYSSTCLKLILGEAKMINTSHINKYIIRL